MSKCKDEVNKPTVDNSAEECCGAYPTNCVVTSDRDLFLRFGKGETLTLVLKRISARIKDIQLQISNVLTFASGTNTTLTGTGTASDPYKYNVNSNIPTTIASSVVDGTIITGITTNAISQSLLIPANTYGASGILDIFLRMTKVGTAGSSTVTVYTNTVNSLSGATLIAGISFGSSSTTHTQGVRTMRINANTLSGYSFSAVSVTDTLGNGTQSSTAFDTAVDNYILFCVQLANSADSANISMAKLTKS